MGEIEAQHTNSKPDPLTGWTTQNSSSTDRVDGWTTQNSKEHQGKSREKVRESVGIVSNESVRVGLCEAYGCGGVVLVDVI